MARRNGINGRNGYRLKEKRKVMEKALLNLKEFCEYLGIGETKAREMLTKTNNNFTVRIGNRLYANKTLLDRWLLNNSGNVVKKRKWS